ncbi:MAG TPA: acyl-CoA dehydrogenase family protein [Trebonia sp.]|jgi:alkylation response protein AidB-like acyl-CoA dehydrogenase|nr:acyl-CoA dehydrogenase family protein [Trebonia sp.]
MPPRPEDDEFRRRAADWLAANVPAELVGAGGPGREHEAFAERVAWNRRLAAAGWTCLGWPAVHGGHDATLRRQMIFYEEYARSRAPARVAVVGEELLGPTLIAYGTPEQQARFLPPIAAVEELWCQGYSEPGAGSDLAAVSTSAVRDGDDWVITGQKVWTSLAHVADWCFVLARTEPGSRRSHGLSYLLVPMRQEQITVRPIRQLTGTSEFNEVFFDGARTHRANVVGAPGDGWRIAKATLEFERGAGLLGQLVGFRRELDDLVELARRSGAGADPLLRDRLARAWVGLEAVRAYALDTLGEPAGPGAEASVLKVLWSRWHQALGELAMDVRGAGSMVGAAAGDWDGWQRLYLFGRADTIYGGSDEIQRNIIAARALGLPRPVRA